MTQDDSIFLWQRKYQQRGSSPDVLDSAVCVKRVGESKNDGAKRDIVCPILRSLLH